MIRVVCPCFKMAS